MPVFQLNCLGTPRLVSPSGDPIRFRTRKHLALLVYLAVEPSTHHRRERLAQMFWPRVALSEARHSLATALSVIRGHIGHRALDGDRETIRLIPGCIATDIAQLASDQPVSPETIGCLGFLAEFEIDGSPDFAHWVDRERARVIPLMQRHISHWLDIARATGTWQSTAAAHAAIGGCGKRTLGGAGDVQ